LLSSFVIIVACNAASLAESLQSLGNLQNLFTAFSPESLGDLFESDESLRAVSLGNLAAQSSSTFFFCLDCKSVIPNIYSALSQAIFATSPLSLVLIALLLIQYFRVCLLAFLKVSISYLSFQF